MLERCVQAFREAAEDAEDNETRRTLSPYPDTSMTDRDVEMLIRAVLETLLSPSDEMVEAMVDNLGFGKGSTWSHGGLKDAFKAAIRKAMEG